MSKYAREEHWARLCAQLPMSSLGFIVLRHQRDVHSRVMQDALIELHNFDYLCPKFLWSRCLLSYLTSGVEALKTFSSTVLCCIVQIWLP